MNCATSLNLLFFFVLLLLPILLPTLPDAFAHPETVKIKVGVEGHHHIIDMWQTKFKSAPSEVPPEFLSSMWFQKNIILVLVVTISVIMCSYTVILFGHDIVKLRS